MSETTAERRRQQTPSQPLPQGRPAEGEGCCWPAVGECPMSRTACRPSGRRGAPVFLDGRAAAKLRRSFGRLALLLIAAALAIMGGAYGAFAAPRTVTVGIYPVEGLQYIDRDGKYAGYTYSYLQAISQYTGWNYKFVQGTHGELTKMLAAGSIDILPALVKTPERAKLYDFPNRSIGESSTKIIVSEKNKGIAYNDIEAFKRIRLGVVTGSDGKFLRQGDLEEYERKNGFKAKLVRFQTITAMLGALRGGEIDAALVGIMKYSSDLRIVASFGMTPFYFAVAKGNRDIVDGIDHALEQINEYEPNFAWRTMRDFIKDSDGMSPVFSKEELDYMKRHKVVRVAYDPLWPPIEYKDPKTGEYSGIMRGVFDEISERTGLKFEFYSGATFVDSAREYIDGKADILSSLTQDYEWSNMHNSILSQIFIDSPVSKVSYARNSEAPDLAALPRGYYAGWKYLRAHPDVKAVYFDSVARCLDEVLAGRARYTICNTYVANCYLAQSRYRRMTARNIAKISGGLSIAVSRRAGPVMLSIINKALTSIPREDIDGIITKNTTYVEHYSILDMIYDNPRWSAALIMMAMGLMLLFIFFLITNRNKLRDTLASVQEQRDLVMLMTDSMNAGLNVRDTSDGDCFKLHYVGDNLCKLLGYTRDELVELSKGTMLDLIHPDDYDGVRRKISEGLEAAGEYNVEYRIRKKNGTYVWIQDAGRSFTDRDGSKRINSVVTNITPLKEAMDELLYRADYDMLTHIYNRHAFCVKTAELIAENADGLYGVICWDIAHFKVFNELYGVAQGDELLHKIGQLMQGALDGKGTCGRLYADNFLMCIPIETYDREKIVCMMTEKLKSFKYDFEFVPNIGIYYVDDKNLPVELMCDRAELAQREAKNSSSTVCVVYDSVLRDKLMREQEIINDMEHALESGQFEVYLQPQYDITTEAVIGAEALVRWNHPEKGLIMPSAFIPVFEKNGFIARLDTYMFESVCRLQRGWLDEGRATVPISVNISRVDIYNTGLCGELVSLVNKYSLPIGLLRLEITETAYAQDAGQLIEAVRKFQASGFNVEMDDFGSGYSSLNALKDVFVDLLKLDMALLPSERNKTERSGNILNSVIRMARWLNLPVLAEGVETSEQVDYLKSLGCDLVQGYYFSRPKPVAEFEDMMQHRVFDSGAKDKERNAATITEGLWNPENQWAMISNTADSVAVLEYCKWTLEMLQSNEKLYSQIGTMSRGELDGYRTNVAPLIDDGDREGFFTALDEAKEIGDEVENVSRWSRPKTRNRSVLLRVKLRLIAKAQDRYIFYSSVENITNTATASQATEDGDIKI